MDLSKLPKLSGTASQEAPANPPIEAVPTVSQPLNYAVAPYSPPSLGQDIFISLAIGILLCCLGGTFGKFAVATLTHHPFHSGVNWESGPKAGSEVDYFELEGFTAWTDMGVFLFGLVLLFEAGAKTMLLFLPGKPARIALVGAIVLTVVGISLNIIACAKLFSIGITPLLSGFAVAFGGWILIDEWRTLKRSNVRTTSDTSI